MTVFWEEDCRCPSANVGADDSGDCNVPIGWRFIPTDEELIVSYLSRKVAMRSLPAKIIKEIDATEFYRHHPKNLVDHLCLLLERESYPCGLEAELYLFINHDEYFHGGINKMKPVGEGNIGFWRSDGKEEAIYDVHGNIFAYKIHSTFFSSESRKTPWKLEKYRLVHDHYNNDEDSRRDEWVVLRIRGGQSLIQKAI